MAVGPGKYDDDATALRLRLKADGVMLLVVNGTKGTGQSVQMQPAHMAVLATALRACADDIDRDLAAIVSDPIMRAVAEGVGIVQAAKADEGAPQ